MHLECILPDCPVVYLGRYRKCRTCYWGKARRLDAMSALSGGTIEDDEHFWQKEEVKPIVENYWRDIDYI